MNQFKPLYCFKIDENNAKITRYQIDAYREIIHNDVAKIEYYAAFSNTHKYKYRHEFTKYNLDKVSNMRIYSFNPDMNHAISILNKELIKRRDEAYKEYTRWNELIIHLNKNMKNQ